jgi:hypothetical protein
MASEKIKLDKDLMDRVRKYAAMAGYASAEEFVAHCLEKELSGLEAGGTEDDIKKKLKGLGYIG